VRETDSKVMSVHSYLGRQSSSTTGRLLVACVPVLYHVSTQDRKDREWERGAEMVYQLNRREWHGNGAGKEREWGTEMGARK
jgi:hypothetical protein